MRLEATVPDTRGAALVKLAEELGLTRSQIIDEALGLFLKAVVEVRRGRRLATIDPESSQPACELASPTLSALEWALVPQKLEFPAEALSQMRALIENPPIPGERLKAAGQRYAKRRRRTAESK